MKNLPANVGDVGDLGWEDPLKEGMATHPSILARITPWTEVPGGIQSMGLQRVRQTEQVTLTLLRKSSLFTNSQCGLWHLFRDLERQWQDR